MKVINAIYNFIVGDMVILVGVALTVLVLALINGVGALAPLRGLTGLILVVVLNEPAIASLIDDSQRITRR